MDVQETSYSQYFMTRCSLNFYKNNLHIDQTLSLTYIALPSIAVVKACVLKQSEATSQSVFTIHARQHQHTQQQQPLQFQIQHLLLLYYFPV